MTFEEALKALNEGKKIRKKWWYAGNYIWLDKENTLKDKNGSKAYASLGFDFKTNNEWEIYEEPVLDEKEKEYLSAVIKPFRERITYIAKVEDDIHWFYWIMIRVDIGFLNDYYDFCLPPFKETSSMYKNMEVGKEYTLDELGL